MRAVATDLGTTASTLYRYVTSRDELVDLMVDTAMAGFAFSPRRGRDWLSELVRLAEARGRSTWRGRGCWTRGRPTPHPVRTR